MFLPFFFSSNIDWLDWNWVQILSNIHTRNIKLGFWNAKFHLWFLAGKQKDIWGLQRGHSILSIIIIILSILDFSCSSLGRDKEKIKPLCGTHGTWMNKWRSLDLLSTFYWINNCAHHCHRHCLIGPLNKTDVITSILHMKKLRMGEISLQDKVHTPGMWYSQDKNTVSSAFPERTLSLYISSYISFLLPIFSPDQVAFLFVICLDQHYQYGSHTLSYRSNVTPRKGPRKKSLEVSGTHSGSCLLIGDYQCIILKLTWIFLVK